MSEIGKASSEADPIPWLLEPENPSVRYLALTTLLDRSEEDPEVGAARAAIPGSQDVQAIFARQDPAGWWDTPEKVYGVKRTSGQLLVLHCLNAPPDERTTRGCEFVLAWPWFPAKGHRDTPLCYMANCLRFLTHFGFAGDPRLDRGWDILGEVMARENGLKCRYEKLPCMWLAVKALWALSVAPGARDVQAAIARLTEALLSHDFDFEGREARWLRFGFPWYYQSDLLDGLEALAACGCATDPRFRALTDHVREKQGDDGRWLKETGSTAVPIERKGRPSKWITLKALRVLKAAERRP